MDSNKNIENNEKETLHEIQYRKLVNTQTIYYSKGHYFVMNASELRTIQKVINTLYQLYLENGKKNKYQLYNDVYVRSKVHNTSFSGCIKLLTPAFLQLRFKFMNGFKVARRMRATPSLLYVFKKMEEMENERSDSEEQTP